MHFHGGGCAFSGGRCAFSGGGCGFPGWGSIGSHRWDRLSGGSQTNKKILRIYDPENLFICLHYFSSAAVLAFLRSRSFFPVRIPRNAKTAMIAILISVLISVEKNAILVPPLLN